MASGTVQIQIENLEQLQTALKNYSQISTPIIADAINTGLAFLAKYTRVGIVPFRTGKLVQSFLPQNATAENLSGSWRPYAIYAAAVYYGMPSSPGRYVPAIGKRLTNPNRGGFGMWPGFKANPYLDRVAAAATPEIQQGFQSAIEDIVKAVADAV